MVDDHVDVLTDPADCSMERCPQEGWRMLEGLASDQPGEQSLGDLLVLVPLADGVRPVELAGCQASCQRLLLFVEQGDDLLEDLLLGGSSQKL